VCSRVGVLNLNTPVKIRSRQNFRFLVEQYFDVKIDSVLKLNKISSHTISVIQTKKLALPNMKKCKKIDWYLRDIKNETSAPSVEVVQFGVLKVQSGRCALIANDSRVDLIQCDPDPNLPPIELTTTGQLRTTDGRCLTTTNEAYIQAEPCAKGNDHQQWQYTSKGELLNLWSMFCARHVTDPAKFKEGRQIAMSQDCGIGAKKDNRFKQWLFVVT